MNKFVDYTFLYIMFAEKNCTDGSLTAKSSTMSGHVSYDRRMKRNDASNVIHVSKCKRSVRAEGGGEEKGQTENQKKLTSRTQNRTEIQR